MSLLIIGLLLFLGAHSMRIFAEGARASAIARLGPLGYKAIYSVVSLLGLVLIAKGYAIARENPVVLWQVWAPGRHAAALLSLLAFVLVVAAYVPRNRLRERLRHPMVLGIKLWAFGHLLANHTLADLILFGTILFWAILDFRAARERDRQAGELAPRPTSGWGDALTVAIGLVAYGAFAFHFHASLIGVRPFG